MSFTINWDALAADGAVSEAVRRFLDERLRGVDMPSYVDGLSVTSFDLGSIAPELTIRHIGDPFDEFYDEDLKDVDERLHDLSMSYMRNEYSSDEDDAGASLPAHATPPGARATAQRRETDVQLVVDVDYQGDLAIELTVDLLVNYPSPRFISLPIKLHVTGLVVHAVAVVAYLRQAVYVSFLCDVADQTPDYADCACHERIDIIKKIHIESDIGEAHQNVLHNVGKVERFLADRLRGLLRDEVAWPGWVCLDLSPD